MSDITINYKNSAIATISASGTTTLSTSGKFCEDDIEIVYVQPGGGGGGTDFTAAWTRPTAWPAMPNDVGTYAGVYYLFKKESGRTTYYISRSSGTYDIGTTNSSGVFTVLAQNNTDTFDIAGLDIGDYFWLRGDGIGTSLINYRYAKEPILETIVSNTNRSFYKDTSSGQAINHNTIHFVANKWTRNYAYDFDYGQDYRVALQCVEFYGGSWERPMTLPFNFNKLVIDSVNITVKDGKIYNSNYGGGICRHRSVSYGTIAINTQNTFALNLGSGSSVEAQSIVDKIGDFTNITNAGNFLVNCHNVTSIDFTGRKLKSVTTATGFFNGSGIETVTWGSDSDFSGVTNFNSICDAARSLQSISFPGTAIHITHNNGMAYAFRYCISCVTIDLSNIDFTNNVTFTSAFASCGKLENLTFKNGAGIAKAIDVSNSSLLTVNSLVSLFNALATVTSATTCKVGSTNLAKLTSDQKAIATDKGWTLS